MSNERTAKRAETYITDEECARWDRRADSLDMGRSEFIRNMVRAGMKKFDATAEPGQTKTDLLRDRDRYKRKYREARKEIERLEDQLDDRERRAVEMAINDHPREGAGFEDIVESVNRTASERITYHLDVLAGDTVVYDSDRNRYYPSESDDSGDDPDRSEDRQ